MIQITESWASKYFSSAIPDLVLTISGTRALVKVTADTDVIFEEALYPDTESKISLTDFDQLVAPYVYKKLLFQLRVDIEEQNVSLDADGNELVTSIQQSNVSTTVVSCLADTGVSAESFCNSRFLSLIDGVRQTSKGRMEYLSYIGSGTAACLATYSDGSTASFSCQTVASGDGWGTVDASPNNFEAAGKQLVSYVISLGSRSQNYEVLQDPEVDVAPILLFFNSFGVQEIAYCTGEHQQIPAFDRKAARVGRKKMNYRIDERETFRADTGVMSYAMANWWREVFRSQDVRVLTDLSVNSPGTPVIITSQDAKLSNAADHLPRYTFEYEYAQVNHNVFDARQEGRIFDFTFDNTFN